MQLSLKQVRYDYPFRIRRNTVPFDDLLRCYERGDYKLDFDVYLPTKGFNLQRDFVWTELQKQEFILSLLKENPIPKISLIQKKTKQSGTEETIYQVIDGKQRLSTYLEFGKNEFHIIVDNKPFFYKDLDELAKYFYDTYSFYGDLAYEYDDAPITDDEKIKWFMQVNFAGTPQDKEHFDKLNN